MEKLYILKTGKGLQNNIATSDIELIREEVDIPQVSSLFFSGTTNKTLEISFTNGSTIVSNAFTDLDTKVTAVSVTGTTTKTLTITNSDASTVSTTFTDETGSGSVVVDSDFNNSSTNPLENQVISNERDILRSNINGISIYNSQKIPYVLASYRSGTQVGNPDGNNITFDREILRLSFTGATTFEDVLFINKSIGNAFSNNIFNVLDISGNEAYFQLSKQKELNTGSGLNTMIPELSGYINTTEITIPNIDPNYTAYEILNGNIITSDSPNSGGFDSNFTLILSKVNPPVGATGSFTAQSGETITVTNGIITNIV